MRDKLACKVSTACLTNMITLFARKSFLFDNKNITQRWRLFGPLLYKQCFITAISEEIKNGEENNTWKISNSFIRFIWAISRYVYIHYESCTASFLHFFILRSQKHENCGSFFFTFNYGIAFSHSMLCWFLCVYKA